MDAEHDARKAVEDDHRRGERPGEEPPARRREPCEEQIDDRGARRVAAGVGSTRYMVEMIDQVGPRAAETELEQTRGENREQRRAAESNRAARPAPVPGEGRQQDDRKSVVAGKRVAERVELGGCSNIKKNNQ